MPSVPQKPSTSNHLTPEKCPICKSDTYMNPDLKILISSCYHKLCEACVVRIFASGTGLCPTCKSTQSKANYKQQTFEDLTVEKEVEIRSRLSKIYNLRQEDFENLTKYNDYLEEFEDIVFALVDNERGAEERIKNFQILNQDKIKKNQQKSLHEQRLLSKHFENEKLEKKKMDQYYLEQLENEEKLKNEQHELMLEELRKSNKSAEEIITETKKLATLKAIQQQKTGNLYIEDNINSKLNKLSDWENVYTQYGNDSNGEDVMYIFEDDYVEPIDYVSDYPFYDPVSKPIINENTAKIGGYLLRYAYQKNIEALYMGMEFDMESIVTNEANSENL